MRNSTKRTICYVMMFGGIIFSSYFAYSYYSQRNITAPPGKEGLTNTGFDAKSPVTVISPRPKEDEKFAHLRIARVNLNLPVFEGTKERQLKKGAAHMPSTKLPGEGGNCVITGHNNTVFKDGVLGELDAGDEIHVEMSCATFVYKVTKKGWIIDAEDRDITIPDGPPVLRLITCYPFGQLSRTSKRFVVEAKLDRKI